MIHADIVQPGPIGKKCALELMSRTAVLMTCYNRKAKTLACLERLFACGRPVLFATLDVYLVDDGSDDGTGSAVTSAFPDVNVIQGTGDLFWCRGMQLAWLTASKAHTYEYFIWLNDDVQLNDQALRILASDVLVTDASAVICGTVASARDGHLTYGGAPKDAHSLTTPTGLPVSCQIINGNVVVVPKAVFDVIGPLDITFHHAIGDYDYGLRAIRAGFKCVVASAVLGLCEPNAKLPAWCRSEIPLHRRFKSLYSPLGYAQPGPYFVYVARHFGLKSAIWQWMSMHFRAMSPRFWQALSGRAHDFPG